MGEIAAADRRGKGKRCTARSKMIQLHSAETATRFHCATRQICMPSASAVHPDFPRLHCATKKFRLHSAIHPSNDSMHRAVGKKSEKPTQPHSAIANTPKGWFQRTVRQIPHPQKFVAAASHSLLSPRSGRRFVAALSSRKKLCSRLHRAFSHSAREEEGNATKWGEEICSNACGQTIWTRECGKKENGWKMFFLRIHWRQILMQL
ncbi:unnamed protein product [Bursaphelenchus xylophilus]|uniref:(pine wood nematode) hypothetical protein n=1 Tax=Bursaphelenchus xylophilus TaxID=6326 RepID=A0A1I7S1L6_BURXY|nr:unnamed protein product [Bursaphelenchus xylophilus]CAG9081295.1 unnamed protein product [Bursaphelenchus xylophilus]